MKRYSMIKALAFCALTGSVVFTGAQIASAGTMDTEIAGAGITVALDKYVEKADNPETEIAAMLPAQLKEINKTEENKYFEDIAITNVSGGDNDYVNVRKKPNTDSKIVGKIYNNCGATILESTDDGWYKIKSGNAVGYIKSDYFATGNEAEDYALDYGYVFANIKDTGIRVRKGPTTESDIITNVYHNENYVIKNFSKDGSWVKIKIAKGVSGWISSEFINVSIDMDTAITIKEEKALIAKQKAEEEALAAAAEAEAQRQADAQAQADASSNTSSGSYSNGSSSSSNSGSSSSGSGSSSSSSSNYSGSSSSSGGASQVVAYAKQFLGNRYVYGGSSLTNGTDCSGFTMSVYAHFGYGLNRSSYTQIYNGRSVSLSSLQAGDLLFYKYGGSTISHVAIYIGGGQIIHASTEETGIIISGMGSPCAARRIIG